MANINWKEIFNYKDGQLFWINPKSNKLKVGDLAGSIKSGGYYSVWYNNKCYSLHRVIWELHHGAIPTGFVIDHINNNPSDNRIENLRLATPKQNAQNGVRIRKKHDLPRGVTRVSGCQTYKAQITYQGKILHLGCFKTPEEASEAYKTKQKQLHGEFAYDR